MRGVVCIQRQHHTQYSVVCSLHTDTASHIVPAGKQPGAHSLLYMVLAHKGCGLDIGVPMSYLWFGWVMFSVCLPYVWNGGLVNWGAKW